MILTINTNGTLLDEAWADFFLPSTRPRRVNITLYGADAASYNRLCHFHRASIRLVAQSGCSAHENVDVKISCSVTKKNPQDFSRILPSDKSSVSLSMPITI